MTRLASALLAVLTLAAPALAGTKLLQNDHFTGSGAVNATVSFADYEGAGVLFTPNPSDYPLTIIAVDVLVVPYNGGAGGAQGAYVLDVWDEDGGTVSPPKFLDGGLRPSGLLAMQGVGFTASNTQFNRFTLAQPLVVTGGKVFVQVSEQLSTALDGTTIALDQGPLVTNANWSFDGYGNFNTFALPDGGVFLNRNWIIRLVLQVPDTAVIVTSVLPNSGPNTVDVPVIIQGTNFQLGATASVGSTALSLTMATTNRLDAIVPKGIVPGTYDVIVRNPDGTEGRLVGGYQVLQGDGGTTGTGGGGGSTGGGGGSTGGGGGGGSASDAGPTALELFDVSPAQAFAADSTNLLITGAGFQTGAQLIIGGKILDGVTVRSAAVLNAILPANSLSKGVYDVTVVNLDGARATLPMAFSVVAGSQTTKAGCGCTSVDVGSLLGAAVVLLAWRRRGR
jgi:hypothetical protein